MTTRCCVARFIRTLSTVISTICLSSLFHGSGSVESLTPLYSTLIHYLMYARTFNCHLRMSLHSIGPVNFYASIVHFSEGLAQMTSRSPQHEYEFLQGWLLLAFSLPQGVYQNAISIPSPQKQ